MSFVSYPALQRLPFSFYFCLGALLAMLVTAIVYQATTTNTLRKRNIDYGQALASMAAKQAVDATLNHDLVSLQVILSDIVQNASVQTAAIHDVENSLLVQAGNSRPLHGVSSSTYSSFTAPITLQDSIAGYVTVSLDISATHSSRNIWLFLALSGAGLIATATIALYRHIRYQSNEETGEPDDNDSIPQSAQNLSDPPASESCHTDISPEFCSELTLYCSNLVTLRQQLNNDLLKQAVGKFEQQIKGVMALYNGKLIHTSSDQIKLAFYHNNSEEESTFHAVCGALLILSLQSLTHSSSQVRLSAGITPAMQYQHSLMDQLQATEIQAQCLNSLEKLPQGTVLVAKALADSGEFQQRVSFHSSSTEKDFFSVNEIRKPYLNLLERQREQLSSLI